MLILHRRAGQWRGLPIQQVWRLRRGGEERLVCRAADWSLNMASEDMYYTIVRCAEKSGATRIALFRTQWALQQPAWDTSKTAAIVRQTSTEAGVTTRAVDSDQGNVYADDFAVS